MWAVGIITKDPRMRAVERLIYVSLGGNSQMILAAGQVVELTDDTIAVANGIIATLRLAVSNVDVIPPRCLVEVAHLALEGTEIIAVLGTADSVERVDV
jgi:hypothetical protein